MYGYEKSLKLAEREMKEAHSIAESIPYNMSVIHSMIDYFYKRVN